MRELTYGKAVTIQEAIALDAIEAVPVRTAVDLWRALSRGRPYPSWNDVTPRYFKKILRHLLIARVVGDCADYEAVISGDAHVEALGLPEWPHRVSDIDEYLPGYSAVLRPLYDKVVRNRAPHALRTFVGPTSESLPSVVTENAFLPLGPDADTVDHIMIASVYSPLSRVFAQEHRSRLAIPRQHASKRQG
jgi:hypothetical protein